jgi:hypothetical protein
MRKIFWLKRRQKSRLDATSALRGVIRRRGNRLRGIVVLAEKQVIMHELVK